MKIGHESIVVDADKCAELAIFVRSVHIPSDREDSSLPSFDRLEIGNFYLLLVAICHQTSPMHAAPLKGMIDGNELRGWDYLSRKLEAEATVCRELLNVDTWTSFTPEALRALYQDDHFGDRLTDIVGRGALINNLGAVMKSHQWKHFEDLYAACERRSITGDPNLTCLLARFDAYRDPVRKKSFFLLSLMRNSGLWDYPDYALLGPPVDYHEVRGHLRIGTVRIHDPDLRMRLLCRVPVSAAEDIEIRQSVVDAIMEVSKLSAIPPSQLHYLFWNIFRSCCTRESPHCVRCPSRPHLPPRYQHLTIHKDGRRCAFSDLCESASATQRYLEHVFETDYY